MEIYIIILLLIASSFGLHAFAMFTSGISLKITRTFISGFIFISLFRAAISLFCGYLIALGLNSLNETNEYEAPWMLFLLSVPVLLITAVYSYISYSRSVRWVKKRISEQVQHTPSVPPEEKPLEK